MATKKVKTLHETLNYIQGKLNAPKDQVNNFGNYKYRSLESILEALKPLLKETGCTCTISDEMVNIGDRYYIKATATLDDGSRTTSVTGWARESLAKKGMDEAQITGTASSYSRKYAMNGLFAICDIKDADTMDNSYYQSELHIMEFGELNDHPAMEGKRKAIKNAWRACGSDEDSEKVLKKMKATIIEYEETKNGVLSD